MAIIYYPVNAQTYIRRVVGGVMNELFIDVAPDQIIVLSGSTVGNAIDFITASYALTYLISSSVCDTASYAKNAGGASVLEIQTFI